MDIEGLDAAGVKTPAHLRPYVAALGVAGARAFFLDLGGSQIYLSRRAKETALAARAVGAEKVRALAEALGNGYIKVPLARQWVAEVMRAQGASDNEIARVVRADVATVRRWLGPQGQGVQLSLEL